MGGCLQLHLATFPGIFSERTRHNFQVTFAAIALSQSNVFKRVMRGVKMHQEKPLQ